MYNDLDDRRRYDQGDRRSRYEETDDGHQTYDDAEAHARNTPRITMPAMPRPITGTGGTGTITSTYEEVPERRSRLVPILTIVAAMLIVAIGVVAALYFLGVFDSSGRPPPAFPPQPSDAASPTRRPRRRAPPVRSVGTRIRAGRPGR